MKKFTVVVQNYNHAHFLPTSLGAILSQTRPPDELIITDDASTDNSLEVMQRYLDHLPWARIIRHEKNQGIYRTAREQFEESTGDYLISCAADDFWDPACFGTLIKALEQYPQAGLACCDSNRLNEVTGVLSKIEMMHGLEDTTYFNPAQARRYMLSNKFFNSVMYRAAWFKKEGGYHPEAGPDGDGVANEILAGVHGFVLVPKILSTFRDTGVNFSSSIKFNPTHALGSMRKSSNLMHAKYPEVFTSDYIRKRNHLGTGRFIWTYSDEIVKSLSQYKDSAMEGSSWLARGLITLFYGLFFLAANLFKYGTCLILLPRLLPDRIRLLLMRLRSKMS